MGAKMDAGVAGEGLASGTSEAGNEAVAETNLGGKREKGARYLGEM